MRGFDSKSRANSGPEHASGRDGKREGGASQPGSMGSEDQVAERPKQGQRLQSRQTSSPATAESMVEGQQKPRILSFFRRRAGHHKSYGRLVIRQEDNISILQQDTQLVFLRNRDSDKKAEDRWSTVPSLHPLGKRWREPKEQDPTNVYQSLKTSLLASL